jgi:hypothetical protein
MDGIHAALTSLSSISLTLKLSFGVRPLTVFNLAGHRGGKRSVLTTFNSFRFNQLFSPPTFATSGTRRYLEQRKINA